MLAEALLLLEAEHVPVEGERAVDVRDLQVDMADVNTRIDRRAHVPTVPLKPSFLRSLRAARTRASGAAGASSAASSPGRSARQRSRPPGQLPRPRTRPTPSGRPS